MRETKNKEYGFCRVSTKHQNIERQVRNILLSYPNAKIVKETFTGTKLDGRETFNRLIATLNEGDTLIFDSVSRMSRNSKEGCELYEKLFKKGIELIFLKESYINTEVYKNALNSQIELNISTGNAPTDRLMTEIISALNKYTIELAKEQIKIAFDQSEKEVKDLHQRTSEGILSAKLAGKQIGQRKGNKLITKKSIDSKNKILKYSETFNGTLNDIECIKFIGISRNSFYKYKKELKNNIE